VDATTAEVDVVIDAAAALGFRDVTVTTEDEVAAGLNLFEVSASADLCPGLAGFDAALCALNASLTLPACDGQILPRSIKKKFTAARNLAKRAAAAKKPKKQQKLLAATARALAAALKGVGKGETRAKKPLTADCVTALRTVITGAESRVQAVTQTPQ
jgi:molybdopterin-guanine dinucleotide biosynthesis protein A